MKTKFSILAFLFIAFDLMAQGVKQSPWTTTTNPTTALGGLGALPAIATPGGGQYIFSGLDGSVLFNQSTFQPAGSYIGSSITNNGIIYSFNSLGQFTMTNPASLPNPSGWTMGTNGHYRGVDQYGNICEWTTNRFMVQISVGGVSKTLMFSNDTLTVDGALVITNGVGIVLPSILSAGALPANVTVASGSSFSGAFQGVGNSVSYGLNLQAVPKKLFIVGHSRSVKLSASTGAAWWSYGGYTNSVAVGGFTNDAWGRRTLYYSPGGSAYTGNYSFWDRMLQKVYGTNGNNIALDTACAVPGNTIWNAWMGLPAAFSYYQDQGFHGAVSYDSTGFYTSVIECGRWEAYVPTATDSSLVCNGTIITNVTVGQRYLFWPGGAVGAYTTLKLYGTPNAVFNGYIYFQQFQGNLYTSPNYLPPYISQGGNGSNSITSIVSWIDSNSPAITGIPASVAIGPLGGNDFLNLTVVDTNLCAYNALVISNVCAHFIAVGFPPPFVLTEDRAMGSTNTAYGTNVSVFNGLLKLLPPSICKVVDIGLTNQLSGFDANSANFGTDSVHYSTNGADLMGLTTLQGTGFGRMDPPPVFTGNVPPYIPGIWDSNLTGNTYYVVPGTSTNASPVNGAVSALTTFATNFTTSTIGSNSWNRPIELFPNVNYGEAGVVGVSSLQLEVVGFSTNYAVPMVTIIGGVAQTLKGSVMPIIVPSGGTWYFRDTSSGAGNSCSPTNGAIQIQ